MQPDMVSDQVVAIPDGSTTSNAATSERGVREASGESVNFRQAGLGEDDVTKSVGQRIGEVRVLRRIHPTASIQRRSQPVEGTELGSQLQRPHSECTNLWKAARSRMRL